MNLSSMVKYFSKILLAILAISSFVFIVPSFVSAADVNYTVQKGDDLYKIAQKFYGEGEGRRGYEIGRSNKLRNLNIIEIGQVLKISNTTVQVETTPAPTSNILAPALNAQTEVETNNNASLIQVAIPHYNYGAPRCVEADYPWYLPLAVQLGFGFVYVYRKLRKREDINLLDFAPIALFAIISQIVHEVFGCYCPAGGWCQRYSILNFIVIGISVLPSAFNILIKKKK